jgi:hypothetical protein
MRDLVLVAGFAEEAPQIDAAQMDAISDELCSLAAKLGTEKTG